MYSRSKLMCLILSVIMLLNSSIVVFAKGNGKNVREVFYDNVKYIIEVKPNKTVITAEGYDVEFELKENGKAKLKGKSVKGLKDGESYDINIKELNDEAIDIDIYKNGQVVEEINSYGELNEQAYEGQAFVIPIAVIGVDVLINVLIAATATIVVASITYVAADAIADTLRKDTPDDYFIAILQDGVVYINSTSITASVATNRIIKGQSIYSYNSIYAYDATKAAGLGVTPSEIDQNRKSGYVYYEFCVCSRFVNL